MRRSAVFLLNLLQDMNIVRPLARLAATDLQAAVLFLVSDRFVDRDLQGQWQAELQLLCDEIAAASQVYASPFDAARALAGRAGVLVAASESNLDAHAHTHDVFRVAPSSFLKVTLQHGFECVGFLHNRDHTKAHGRNITFAADVICGWCDLPRMSAVAASERPKYLLTGPTALLQPVPDAPDDGASGGLVCENLHSVRLRTSGDFRASFIDTFTSFCAELDRQGQRVTIRPHPGGQYVLKNNVPLPANVGLDNRPMYRVDLRSYAWGLSAPSSVLIDMVLAGIPTAVWQDEDGIIDAANYDGLALVSTLVDWLAFERDVKLRPAVFARLQSRFLQRSGLLADRAVVRQRFVQLLAAGFALAGARA